MGYLYIAGCVLCTVYGQLILKWRVEKYGALPEVFIDKVYFFLKVLLDPFILSGLIAAFIASLFWIAAMTVFDLSYAYPFVTAGLTLITVILAVILFDEALSTLNVIGLLLIISGVAIASYSST